MPDLPTNDPENRAPARRAVSTTDISWTDLAGKTAGGGRWRIPSRENLMTGLKTFAWVAPLTLLIWVYAEREQLANEPLVTIPIEVKSSDPNRIVRLAREDTNITATLAGPRAALDHVRQMLMPSNGTTPVQIEVDKNLAPGQIHFIPTEMNVAKRSIFRDYGISVTNCQPDQLPVEVDELIERKVDVQLPPAITNLSAAPVFEPRQVTVRGPKGVLQKAIDEGRLTVFVEVGSDVLKTPGRHDLQNVTVTSSTRDENVTVNPATIRATLDVREADVRYVVDAMSVFVAGPTSVLDKYRIVFPNSPPNTPPSLPNVTLIGPPKTIEMMQRPDFAPKPKAMIEVSSEDVTNPKPKHIRYPDLPEGVIPSPEDQRRTVEIRLVDRATE